ncbi:hypothetical protein H4S08_000638 [Coemansia sp. RSA 1365]|nr:hypothetical protein H4S08_000638 [Coemansia sp. RSA 1365]
MTDSRRSSSAVALVRTHNTNVKLFLPDSRLDTVSSATRSQKNNHGSSHARTLGYWRRTAWLQCIAALVLLLLVSPVVAANSNLAVADASLQESYPSPTPAPVGNTELGELLFERGIAEEDSSEAESESDEEESQSSDDGSIGIVGAFNGVSSFSPNSSGSALSLNSSMTSFVALSQNAVELLAAGSSVGNVVAACALYKDDGTFAKAYFGGTISMLNSTTLGYVFGVDAAGKFDAMTGGVNGPVNALYCDDKTQLVYVGGNFTNTVSGLTTSVATMRSLSTGGLAVYKASQRTWQALSFHGLDGPVFDFAKMKDNVYAVGAFAATVDNATYVPLNTQPVDLSSCKITGGNNADTAGFNDPHNIICTTGRDSVGNTWLMRDKLPGYYRIDFPFKTTPSLLRLMNTLYQRRGTKAIRVEAVPNNQALTMSYLDPETRTEMFCTQSCPMLQNYDWQEFRFVDNDLTLANITGVTVNIVDWYGMGGGFNKIELYQRGKYIIFRYYAASVYARIYAIDGFNSLPCTTQAIRPSSAVMGSWRRTTAASYHGEYLTLSVNVNDIKSEQAQNATVTMVPFVPESGFYKVYMTIPGCQNTNTCLQRTSAKVTWLMDGGRSILTTVTQHNLEDLEIELFSGYAPASSTKFSSAIYVGISPNATVDPQATSAEVVVDSFRLERITSYTDLNGVLQMFEDQSADIQRNGPLYLPLVKGLPTGSVVHTAAYGVTNDTQQDDTLFLGGQFQDADKGYSNVAQYRGKSVRSLGGTGIQGIVRSMAFVDASLFIGGSFDGTSDGSQALNNVAEFNTTDQKWYQLVGGVNNAVTEVVPYSPFGSRAVAFTGAFQSLYTGDVSDPTEIQANGLAMWDTLAGGWTNTPYLQSSPSVLHAGAYRNNVDNTALAAGRFAAAAALEANGAVLLSPQQNIQAIDMMGFELQPTSDGQFIVNTGLWYAKNSDASSALIVGGRFSTLDGATNVARLDDGKWRKVLDGVGGEVLTLNNAANWLFIGGVADESAGFSGLTVLDMDRRKEVGIQQLQGPDGDFTGVRISKVAIRKDTSMVVVGGNFATAGGMLSCPYICTLDINESQWSPLSTSTLIGPVVDMLFTEDSFVVAGTFKNGTEPTLYLQQYRFDDNSWIDVPGADKLPGPVTVLSAASNGEETTSSFYIVGTSSDSDAAPYFAKFDGKSITNLPFTIDAKSTIHGVLEVPRSRIPNSVLGSSRALSRRSDSDSDPIVPSGYVLAISGDLYLPNRHRASNAFFYNDKWAPFLSTVQDSGMPGFISSVFFEIPPTNVYQRQRLSVALVILIAIAIALGITFLIVFIGLVYIYLRNRREAAATASAASAALAATTGGAGTTKGPINPTLVGAAAAAAAGGGLLAAGARHGDQHRSVVPTRDTWGNNALTGERVSFDNIAPNTGRLNSGSPTALGGLAAAAGRQAAVSSDTYVHHDAKKSNAKYDDTNESLESIFESAAAEAEAEAESEARERAASTSSIGADVAAAGGAAAAAAAAYKMPIPRHYNGGRDAAAAGELSDTSRSSMYRPDSTNPFEQRMALRESQGDFPPAGPFGNGEDGVGHIPMPSPHSMQAEHATAAALAGASAGMGLAGMAAKSDNKDNRRRSESASTRDTEGAFSASRPSGESSVGGSSTNLPIRDSLKQYPVSYAKFTFSSRETGELGFRAGERVFVIDQSDEIWWMGIVDHGPNQPLEQGVFPATYVSSDPPKSTEWPELM